jgi:hypothetical protein
VERRDVFGRLFRVKTNPFTHYCERITLRTIADVTRLDGEAVRSFLGGLSVEPKWAELLQNAPYPGQSLLLCLIVLRAAADFLRRFRRNKVQQNPINSITPDVAMIEASFFFWYALASSIAGGIEHGTFSELDKEASVCAGTILCQIIQATTHWPIAESFASRLQNYRHAGPGKLDHSFFEVLLRSVGKRKINEPDQDVDPRAKYSDVSDITMHMVAMLPSHLELYRDATENFAAG